MTDTASTGRDVRDSPCVPAVLLEDARFGYSEDTTVLHVPMLRVDAGERVFIFGPSGSGKTTLLGLVAGVLPPGGGRVEVLGADMSALSSRRRDALRASHIGYIFQMFNLIPYLSVEDNIVLPCRLSRERRGRLGGVDMRAAAATLADSLEIRGLMAEKVTRLSVGQQQRVAAARALIGSPGLVVADEPTSALDSDRRERFLELLFEQCSASGATLLFVSHDRQLEHVFDRALSLDDLNIASQR